MKNLNLYKSKQEKFSTHFEANCASKKMETKSQDNELTTGKQINKTQKSTTGAMKTEY